MFASMFIAKIFAWYMLIMGFIMLLKKEQMIRMVKSLLANEGAMFIAAIMTLIIGVLLVVSHNIWLIGHAAVITIACWLTLLKGIFWLCCPNFISKTATVLENPKAYMFSVILTLVIGFYFLYLGYF